MFAQFGKVRMCVWSTEKDCVCRTLNNVCVCVGLKVPSNCELVVGGEPQCWSEGSCLLFDDSFLHTAFHDGERERERGLRPKLCIIL